MRTREQVDDLLNRCQDQIDEGGSEYPGMSYEDGIAAALRWAYDDDTDPLDD